MSAEKGNTCFRFCASQIGAGFALTTVSHFDQRLTKDGLVILMGDLII